MISISVSNDSISLEMTLEDFLIALSDEVAEPLAASIAEGAGNPAFWFTKKALTDNLVKALESKLALEHFIEATNKRKHLGAAKERARLPTAPEGTLNVDHPEEGAANRSLDPHGVPEKGETFYDTEADIDND